MLKIIYGKSGTGKSFNLYNDIKENLSFGKIFLIVPEQSNLSAEQKLLEFLGINSLINIEVLTLSRMASRILEEVGYLKENNLTKAGKAMVIYDILNKQKNNLKFLGNSDKNIDIVMNMITEFKKHNITEEALNNLNISNVYTKLKLEDMKIIYEEYHKKIENNFIDENDLLTIISSKISKSELFKNSLIYIDDFNGFTPQEYIVFEELLKVTKKLTVIVSTDCLKAVDKERDIFYFNKIFANKLIKIAEKNNIEIEKVGLNNNQRIKSEEIKALEENLFNYSNIKVFEKENKDINLFLANNIYSEIENVVKEILNLVKNEGYDYKDINIITDNIEAYDNEVKIICEKYGIPIFIDEKRELNQNILIKFILSLIDIFAKNWSFDAVFNYLKIGLLDIDNLQIAELEEYCTKWGIKNYKWFKEFNYEEVNEKQEKLESLRKVIIEPLVEFKNQVFENKTVKQISKVIYEFLISNNIDKKLDEKIKQANNIEINNEYNTSYKIIIDILNELVQIFGDGKITFDDYRNLLQIGLSSSELGKIPATQNKVILGDLRRSRSDNIKVSFIIGINDGSFPSFNKFEGYLDDNDREILKEAGMEIAKTSLELLYEKNFDIYNMLATPSDKLFLSFASSDNEGKGLRPSILIKKIKKVFPNLKENSDIINKKYIITNETATFDDSISVYGEYLNGKEISEEWKKVLSYYNYKNNDRFKNIVKSINYTNQAEIISEENINKMYGNKLKTSVSRLEQYKRCPFAFHMQYGLKLKEKEELKIQALDTGNFMHEVIDVFFEKIDKNNLDIKTIDDGEVKNLINSIIDELLSSYKYYKLSSTAKFKTLTKRLKKVVSESIEYIVYSIRNSKFEVLGHEIEFSNSGKYKPIIIEMQDGRKIEITGKIDRVDIGTYEDKKYVRIIDYKSSIKNIDMNQVEAGLQIQLITYLDAISIAEDFLPSGMLYLGLVDNIIKSNKNMLDEDIKQEIRRKFRMNGLVLADINIIKMMDTNLDIGASNIVPVTIKKDGEISESKSSVLKEEKFIELQEKVNKLIKEISKEIFSGKIAIEPYNYNKHTGCDYCEYKAICNFDPNFKDNTYNYIKKSY